jgi:Domain of unknown function (DUF1330)
VLGFPAREAALAWYHLPQYRDLRDLRWSAATATILLADGVDAPPGWASGGPRESMVGPYYRKEWVVRANHWLGRALWV